MSNPKFIYECPYCKGDVVRNILFGFYNCLKCRERFDTCHGIPFEPNYLNLKYVDGKVKEQENVTDTGN